MQSCVTLQPLCSSINSDGIQLDSILPVREAKRVCKKEMRYPNERQIESKKNAVLQTLEIKERSDAN